MRHYLAILALSLLPAAPAIAAPAPAGDTDEPDLAPPPKAPKAGSGSCRTISADLVKGYRASASDDNPVSFADVISDLGGPNPDQESSAPLCDDAAARAVREALVSAAADAKPAKAGTKMKGLEALVEQRMKRSFRNRSGFDVISAQAVDREKRLVGDRGDLGKIRRISVLARAKAASVCLEIRGDWRNSTLQEDQDDPIYVVFDRLGGNMGWRNQSGRENAPGPIAWLRPCPRGGR